MIVRLRLGAYGGSGCGGQVADEAACDAFDKVAEGTARGTFTVAVGVIAVASASASAIASSSASASSSAILWPGHDQ